MAITATEERRDDVSVMSHGRPRRVYDITVDADGDAEYTFETPFKEVPKLLSTALFAASGVGTVVVKAITETSVTVTLAATSGASTATVVLAGRK